MVPQIIDTGPPPPLPPPFDPPPRDLAVVFTGKGRRLVDDDPVLYPTILVKTQNPKTERKPGGVSGRARTQRFDQLALMPVA